MVLFAVPSKVTPYYTEENWVASTLKIFRIRT